MGQIESGLAPNGPPGTFKVTDGDNPEFVGDGHPNYNRERRPTIIHRISRQASLIPESLAETERFVKGVRKPHIDHRLNGISKIEAGIQLFKVLVGTGILFMPKAFKATGIIQGILLTSGIALLTMLLNSFIIQVAQHFCKIDGISSYSYSDTARLAFNKWPKLTRFANAAQYLISSLIFLSTYSIMIIDVWIVAKNLQDIFLYFKTVLNYNLAVIMQLPIQIALNTATGLKRLTPITIGALTFIWSGIGLTAYYITDMLIKEGPKPVSNWNSPEFLSQYFAIALMSFNSIATLTSIENNMREPSSFIGTPSVLCCVISLAAFMYCGYGILGYCTFGVLTQAPVTNNLAPQSSVALILKACITFGLMLTCPILFYPALSVVSAYIESKFNSSLLNYASRWVQICIVVVIPIMISDVMVLMQLLGGFFITLQYIMPVIIETLAFWDKRKGSAKFVAVLRNFIMFLIGVGMMAITFYTGVQEFIANLKKID